jgi:nitroreductase
MHPAGAPTLHPLLASRWSPTVFDAEDAVSPAEVESLLEAARWAPSAGNSQPWAFIVGVRGEPDHARLVRHLMPSSARWAADAGLLLANLSHRYVEGTDWEFSEFSVYDLGQAVAHLTLQARSLGMHVRQFRAFRRESLAEEFGVPEHWEVTTMAAVGRVPADVGELPATSGPGTGARSRKAVDELRWGAAVSG